MNFEKTITDWREKRPFRVASYGAALVLLFCATVSFFSEDAYALKITMKRIVFEGPKRAEALTIINNTDEPATFRLGWRTMRMTEDQSLVSVDDPEEAKKMMNADSMIRYAPRRITIAPGASQQVRLLLRKPKDLADGEYRSHLWIQPEAESVKFEAFDEEGAKTQPVVQLKMLTGITLPVFVRHGKLTVKTTISDARVAKAADGKGMNVGFTLNREGTRSIYGDFTFTCTGGGKEVMARQISGLAVYTEVTKRFMNFTIPYPAGGAAACSKLRIDYKAPIDDTEFKGALLASATASVK